MTSETNTNWSALNTAVMTRTRTSTLDSVSVIPISFERPLDGPERPGDGDEEDDEEVVGYRHRRGSDDDTDDLRPTAFLMVGSLILRTVTTPIQTPSSEDSMAISLSSGPKKAAFTPSAASVANSMKAAIGRDGAEYEEGEKDGYPPRSNCR